MIRTQAIALGIPYTTTMAGAQAVVTAIEAAGETGMSVKSIQEYYKEARKK